MMSLNAEKNFHGLKSSIQKMICRKIAVFLLFPLKIHFLPPTIEEAKEKTIRTDFQVGFRLSITIFYVHPEATFQCCLTRPESRDNAWVCYWKTEQSLQNKKKIEYNTYSVNWQLINDDHPMSMSVESDPTLLFFCTAFTFNCRYHCSCNFLWAFSFHIITQKWRINDFYPALFIVLLYDEKPVSFFSLWCTALETELRVVCVLSL